MSLNLFLIFFPFSTLSLYFCFFFVVCVHRMRSAPISRCTSVLYVMKMTLDPFGWWMMRSSSKGVTCHEVDLESMILLHHRLHHPTIPLHSKHMPMHSHIHINQRIRSSFSFHCICTIGNRLSDSFIE